MIGTKNRNSGGCGLSGEDAARLGEAVQAALAPLGQDSPAAIAAARILGTEMGRNAAQAALGNCPCGRQGPCTCGRRHHGPKFTGNVNFNANVNKDAVDVDLRVRGTFSKKLSPGAEALAGLGGVRR